MKKITQHTSVLFFLVWFQIASCTVADQRFHADKTLTTEEQTEFLNKIIRYAGHLAPNSNHATKFYPDFDSHYMQLATKHKVELFFEDGTSGKQFFLITRPAPSLYERRVAIAGKVKLNNDGVITHYEELFRTWKLSPNELKTKSELLFRKAISGEDLSMYYPENSGDEEYIEFPNQFTSFDTEKRQWITTLFSLSEEIVNSN